MQNRKRKKIRKRRAHTTHGYGSMKKNRGKGNKGGSGNAGTGKKADSKKPSINVGEYFGKYGFHSVKSRLNTISIYELIIKIPEFEKKEAISKSGNTCNLDLSKSGYDKLLGTGKIGGKFNVKVKFASEKAISKIESAGGKVELTEKKKIEIVEENSNEKSAEDIE